MATIIPINPFAPRPDPVTPCWHCRYMLTVDPRSHIITCNVSGGASCKSSGTLDGCELWEREPGTDDEPYPADRPTTVHELQPAPRSRGRDGWWTEPPRPPMRPRAPRQPAPPAPPAYVPPVGDFCGGIFADGDDDVAILMQGDLVMEGYLPRLGRGDVSPRVQGQR